MEDTTKFISLLLLVFPLSTEANHGGEWRNCSDYIRAKFLVRVTNNVLPENSNTLVKLLSWHS